MLSLIALIFLLNFSDVLGATSGNREIYPLVNVTQGQLQGILKTSPRTGIKAYVFKDVPYAQPPVGPLRFKAPLPPLPWSGIRNAHKRGNRCAHYYFLNKTAYGNEDCLNLNIYVPYMPKYEDKKFPVLINIHDGNLAYGDANAVHFDPHEYLRQKIIVVSVQYRLGIFGFLCLDTPNIPGNAGLKDQLMAIKWVKANIKQFNGDANDITLYGVGGGSSSVEFQLLNTKSKGLFHKVIMSSGSVNTNWAMQQNKTKVLEKLSNHLGVSNEPSLILNALMAMDTDNITITAYDIELRKTGTIATQFSAVEEMTFPNVDSFLRNHPLDYYKSGNYLKIPSFGTFCRNEGVSFRNFYGEENLKSLMNRKYNEFVNFVDITDPNAFNENLTRLYSSLNETEEVQAYEFLSDMLFFSGIYQTNKYMMIEPLDGPHHYRYMFAFVGNQTMSFSEKPQGTVPHGSDAAYLNGYFEDMLSDEEITAKKCLAAMHTDFVKYGNPTITFHLTNWIPINRSEINILKIENHKGAMVPFPFPRRMQFWDHLFNNK